MAAVFIQWPYLVISSIRDLTISDSRWWIAFSYSFFPFMFLAFFLLDGILSRSYKWFWLALGIVALTYLPQAYNQFNAVFESSCLFLVYLYLDDKSKEGKLGIIKFFLIVFFVLSHEISILYTLFIVLLPSLKASLEAGKIQFAYNKESIWALIATAVIIGHFFFLPKAEHIELGSLFESYLANPILKMIFLFFLICLFSRRQNIIYPLSLVLFGLLIFYFPQDLVGHHYPYRLLVSGLTICWFLISYVRPNLTEDKLVRLLLLVFLVVWSVKDLEISRKWDHGLKQLLTYLDGKEGCFQETSQEPYVRFKHLGYFPRSVVLFVGLSFSESFEKPRIVNLPMSESKTKNPDFNACEYVTEYAFPMDERAEKQRWNFWFEQKERFNWDYFYNQLPVPQLKLGQPYSPLKRMMITGTWITDDLSLNGKTQYQIRLRLKGECLNQICPQVKLSLMDKNWTFFVTDQMKDYDFIYHSEDEVVTVARLEYLNDMYVSEDEDMNLVLEKIDISPIRVTKKNYLSGTL